MPVSDEALRDAIINKGLLKDKVIDSFLKNAKDSKTSLNTLLVEREVLPDDVLGKLVAELYEVPFVQLKDKNISEHVLRLVPFTLATHQYILPFEQTPQEIKVGLNDPQSYELINFLEKKTGLKVVPYYATKKDIQYSLKVYNRDVNTKFKTLLKSALKDPNQIESLKDAAKILDVIILFAYQSNASDIHIEPHKDFLGIRYRIDGLLQSIAELPMDILELLCTRIKVLASLRTDEHRAAQDGRIKITLEDNEITLRVSIIPTYDGEKTVMRLLSSPRQELNLEALGFSDQNLTIIRRNLLKTNGIILVTGPTGSGKTTTLYSILKQLNSPEINIATIEDPIEYRLEGVNQIQVNPKTDLTFANGLRSLLRQDPDVIMVGEIRDKETAGIAVNAALTGHLVLATLHTNDVAGTLPRLIDMGIEQFLVATTAQLVVAQRLVRTICEKCKKSYKVSVQQIQDIGEKYNLKAELNSKLTELSQGKEIVFYRGEGCDACGDSGFKGRITITESMEVTENIRKLIFNNSSPVDIEKQAIAEGMIPMFIDGLQKVLQGKTTIEEVLRVMHS